MISRPAIYIFLTITPHLIQNIVISLGIPNKKKSSKIMLYKYKKKCDNFAIYFQDLF